MNWHLFLDEIAWPLGMFSSVAVLFIVIARYKIRKRFAAIWKKEDGVLLWLLLILATLCWAWIIAG